MGKSYFCYMILKYMDRLCCYSRFYTRDIRAVDIHKMIPWQLVSNMFSLWELSLYTYDARKADTSVWEINKPNQIKILIKLFEGFQIQFLYFNLR